MWSRIDLQIAGGLHPNMAFTMVVYTFRSETVPVDIEVQSFTLAEPEIERLWLDGDGPSSVSLSSRCHGTTTNHTNQTSSELLG